jgi:hypothetical protein
VRKKSGRCAFSAMELNHAVKINVKNSVGIQ